MKYDTITKEVVDRVCHYVKEGACFRDAYLLSGINKHTGEMWRRRRSEGGLFEDLYDGMNRARAEFHMSMVELVKAAGKDDWKAAMTVLERSCADQYSRNHTVKDFDGLGIDPETQSPLEMMSKLIVGLKHGEISTEDAKKFAEIISMMVKTEENSELKEIVEQLKEKIYKH